MILIFSVLILRVTEGSKAPLMKGSGASSGMRDTGCAPLTFRNERDGETNS
jgi:hypothetical protein